MRKSTNYKVKVYGTLEQAFGTKVLNEGSFVSCRPLLDAIWNLQYHY